MMADFLRRLHLLLELPCLAYGVSLPVVDNGDTCIDDDSITSALVCNAVILIRVLLPTSPVVW